MESRPRGRKERVDREREASKMWRKDEALGGGGGAVEKHTRLLREDFEP